MADILRITPREVPQGAVADRPLGAAAILIALGLLLMASDGPRLIAGLLQIGGDPGAAALQENEPAAPDVLDAVIESRALAAAWYDSPEFSLDTGFAAMRAYSYLQGLPTPATDEQKRYLHLAIDGFQKGLSAAPVNAYAWMQLAYADLIQSGRSPHMQQYLEMSIRCGPQEPALTVPRIVLALAAWDHFDLAGRTLIIRQVIDAATYRPQELAATARRLGFGDVIRKMLAREPELQEEFTQFSAIPEAGSPLLR